MYRITITETKTETKLVGREWELTGEQSHAVYGYTPEIIKSVEVSREILAQTIEDLDLPAVIKAINGI